MICVRHNLDLGAALECQQCLAEVAEEAKAQEGVRDFILAERDKGNVVVMGIEGMMSMPLDKFVEQPADGILYDLNRLEEVCLTFISEKKWVNDFAVALTIRKLVEERDQLKHDMERGMANHNADLNNGLYVPPAWIPVGERLPDDDALVYLPLSKTVHVAFVAEDGNWYNPHGDGESVFAKPDSSNGPSHWMPLPSGPISPETTK